MITVSGWGGKAILQSVFSRKPDSKFVFAKKYLIWLTNIGNYFLAVQAKNPIKTSVWIFVALISRADLFANEGKK